MLGPSRGTLASPRPSSLAPSRYTYGLWQEAGEVGEEGGGGGGDGRRRTQGLACCCCSCKIEQDLEETGWLCNRQELVYDKNPQSVIFVNLMYDKVMLTRTLLYDKSLQSAIFMNPQW
eukprot:TRINITY_DN2483_c0_g1_i8.p1 TRINITY_DN2483_c0_g1~~TRINITY_DN2483_c0_g1_i8.p1  ORF type:complete len:118 (+),score=16.29 TRINITY_DN2483_c0_g1_i8:437-790(+)